MIFLMSANKEMEMIDWACYHVVMRADWMNGPRDSWRYRLWLLLLARAGRHANASSDAQGESNEPV